MKKATRIMLALQNKLTCKQNEAKVKRLRKGIEVAIINADEKAAAAQDELDDLVQNFNIDTDVQEFIKNVSKAMYANEEAESAIKQLNRINNFLFEEMDVPDGPEKQED